MSKKKIITISVIVGIILIMFIIRTINMSKKDKVQDTTVTTETVQTQVTEVTTEEPEDSYKQSLGIGNEEDDGRVEVDDEDTTETTTEYVQTEPTYAVSVNIFDHTEVPTKMMDGTSCINYYNNVSLNSFSSYWGTPLTQDDFVGHKKYLVGVSQDPTNTEVGDLQSVGWLMDNLEAEKFQANDAIKFTNLHIIGSLSDNHVALLCCYDWYSAWGITDTLVMFEDISNTLKVSDFKEGDIFSATVFVHNMKVENVNGKRVVVVQYTTFDAVETEDTTENTTTERDDLLPSVDDLQ